MKVEKEKFDLLLRKMLQQKPEKTKAIKGEKRQPKPIIPPLPRNEEMSERYARSCAGKRSYASERRASEAAKESQIVFGQPMNAYECRYCGRWHVGSTFPWDARSERRAQEMTP